MIDHRYIPPSEREHKALTAYSRLFAITKLLDHAAFMDEQSVRDRDLIKRLADALDDVESYRPDPCSGGDCDVCSTWCRTQGDFDRYARLVAEARGIEADNEDALRAAMAEMAHLAKDAQSEWEQEEQFTPLAEYQRGYMNAMHQALNIIERETNVLADYKAGVSNE